MEHEQRAAGLEHAGEFHERSLLIATGFVNVFEHAHAHNGRKSGVFEGEPDGFVAPHVPKQRLPGHCRGRFVERQADGFMAVQREKKREVAVAAAPVEHRVAWRTTFSGLAEWKPILGDVRQRPPLHDLVREAAALGRPIDVFDGGRHGHGRISRTRAANRSPAGVRFPPAKRRRFPPMWAGARFPVREP